MTTADLNGDGKLDLVVADYQGGVAVLLGDGSGGFGTAATYTAGPTPYSATTADVNGDGKLDLVVADYFGGVAVLLGDGGGGFGTATTYAAGSGPFSVTAADVNGDGKPDLVVIDEQGGVSVLLNSSTAIGTFGPHSAATATGQDTGLVIDTTLPTITGATANQPTTDLGTVTPFSFVDIRDTFPGAAPDLTITLRAGGAATDANGTLSGFGLSQTGVGVYTLAAAATPEILASRMRALVFTPTHDQVPVGQVVATEFDLLLADAPNSATNTTTSVNATDVACFRAGTLIRTPSGEAAVETLRPGDLVTTASGLARPVRWVGRRALDLAGHPDAAQVRPIRVRAHAFAPGQPCRDLWLSPEHAVFVDGALIPIRHLVNGASIAPDPGPTSVTYCHLELDRHDILLAEGLPAESWLDTGNRAMFANAAVTALAFDERRGAASEGACAELVEHGPRLEAVRRRLGAAGVLDITLDHVGAHRHAIPAGATTIRLLSPPGHAPGDRRRLGAAIRCLVLDGMPLALTDASLQGGFHPPEQSWRWTDGAAFIAAGNAAELTVEVVALAPLSANRLARVAA